MARSDFNYIPVRRTFDANHATWAVDFAVNVGNGLEIVDDGYVMITARGVDSDNHRIQINHQDLSSFDVPLPHGDPDAWLTYMARIPPGLLQAGLNTIRITRVGDDDFVVRDLVVHWREN